MLHFHAARPAKQKDGRDGYCVCHSRESSRVSTQTPLHKYSGLPKHLLLSPQLRWASDTRSSCFHLQERWDHTRPPQHPFPMGVLAFLYILPFHCIHLRLASDTRCSSTLYTLSISLCVGGGRLHITHSGCLVCCWLGHLSLIQCERLEAGGF